MKQQGNYLYYYSPACNSMCLSHLPVHHEESHHEMLGLEPQQWNSWPMEQLATQKKFLCVLQHVL